MDYVKFFYRPLATQAARQALVGRERTRGAAERGRYARSDVDALLKTAPGDRRFGRPLGPRLGTLLLSRFSRGPLSKPTEGEPLNENREDYDCEGHGQDQNFLIASRQGQG